MLEGFQGVTKGEVTEEAKLLAHLEELKEDGEASILPEETKMRRTGLMF